MKIKIQKDELKKAISLCMPAIAKNATNPLMEGLLFSCSSSEAKITAYDFSNAIITNIDCVVVTPGETVVSAKLLSQIIDKCTNEIVINTDGNQCHIDNLSSNYQIPVIDATQYPDLPVVNDIADEVSVQTDILKKAAKKVCPFTSSREGNNTMLHTVLLETENSTLNVVACDGFRVIKYSAPTDVSVNTSLNIEKNVFRNIASIDSDVITIKQGRRHNIIVADNVTYIVRKYDGEFIDYRSVMSIAPVTEGKVEISRFGDAISMACPVVENTEKTPVRIHFGDDIEISSRSALGSMRTRCPMEQSVDNIEIGFNSRFLLDAVAACSDEVVSIALIDAVSPLKITDSDTEIVILPMRIAAVN